MKQRGQGLVEVMVAVALLAVLSATLAYLVVSSKSESIKVEGYGTCQERARLIVNAFKSADNKAQVDNWVQSSGGSRSAPPLTSLKHPERFYNQWPVGPVAGTPLNNATIQLALNNWELINSGTNWALALYNSGRYCSPSHTASSQKITPGVALPGWTSAILPAGNLLKNEQDYINVELFDFSQNASAGCFAGGTPQRIIPKGISNSAMPETNYGLLLTATTTYTDSQGLLQSCNVQTQLRPDGDTVAPVWVAPPIQPVTGTCTGCGGAGPSVHLGTNTRVADYPTQNPPAICGFGTPPVVHATFGVNESGVMFGCEVEYSPTSYAALPAAPASDYQNCSTFTFNFTDALGNPVTLTGHGLNYYPPTKPPNNITGLEITMMNPPEGFFELFVTAWDSAMNQVAAPQVKKFGVDLTRPDINVIIPPQPLIQGFGPTGFNTQGSPVPGNAVASHYYVPAPFNTAVAFPSPGLYQCEQAANDTQYWTTKTTNSVPQIPQVAEVGASWVIDNRFGKGDEGWCVVVGKNPFPVVDGSVHTVMGYPCDTCLNTTTGPVFPTSSPAVAQFQADFNGTITAQHAPNGFPPIPSFSPTVAPLFTLTPAKSSGQWGYACQNITAPAWSQVKASCNPAGFTSFSCTDRPGAYGFCTQAFDACGRSAASLPTQYRVAAQNIGDNCRQTPCAPGLICVVNGGGTATEGTCQAPVSCSFDGDCPSNMPRCFFTPPNIPNGGVPGICGGNSPGPVTAGSGSAPFVCPNLNQACGGQSSQCTPTCDAGTQASACYYYTFADSCGNPGACAGQNMVVAACAVPSPPPPSPTASPQMPSPSPTPTPSPTPSPPPGFACSMQYNSNCTLQGSACAQGSPNPSGFYVSCSPHPPAPCFSPLPSGSPPSFACGSNATKQTVCVSYSPCPTLMNRGLPCNAGYECVSGVCSAGTCQ